MDQIRTRMLPGDGVQLHVADCGAGRPVVFLHGFPELWYSWRHQLPVVARAGRHAIAPDMRGFGRSERPDSIEAYDAFSLARDVVSLVDDLGLGRFVVVGHDWGADVAWKLALAHADRVDAVVAMSVPFVPRAPAPPIDLMRKGFGEDFYIVWFQEPGVADEVLARDPRRTLSTPQVWTADWAESDEQPERPRWMTEEDLDYYLACYTRTGFTGGLNWYRNIDRNWELMEPYAETKIEQPALFITGSRDTVKQFMPVEAMDGWVTNLEVLEIEGAGHWVQQERPEEVNAALLDFLAKV